MARGPWLHVTLFVTSLARGATAVAAPQATAPQATAPNEDEANPATPTEDPPVHGGALINEGQALFDTADYVGAIERWTEAYAQLPDDAHLAAARNLLAYQIAQAHIEAFTMDPQLSHLRKAERLLRQYLTALDPTEAEAFAAARRLLLTVEGQIRAATPPPVEIRPVPPPPRPSSERPAPRKLPPRGPRMLLGGISLGLGGALLIGTAVSAVLDANIDDERKIIEHDATRAELDRLNLRDTRAHQATIVTAVAGSVMIVTGIALVITGRVHKRTLTAQPALSPGFAGARLSLRF